MTITRKHLFSFLFLSTFLLISVLSVISQPAAVQAAAAPNSTLLESQTGINELGQVYGNQRTDLRVTVAKIIQIILGFLGVIFFGLTLFAGFKYMTAGGNEEKAREAIKLLTNAVIGLLIILMSWAITTFLVRRLTAAINNNVNLWYPN